MGARLALADHVTSEQVQGDLALLDLNTGEYYELNETASLIVAALEAGEDPATVAERIAADFEVGEQQARADVDALVTQLREAGLLVESDTEQPK